MSGCVRCGEKVPEELKIRFTECKHHIHADCLQSDPNKSFKTCGLCLGYYEPVTQAATQQSQIRAKPRLLDGKDWCIKPGMRNTGSKLASVASYMPLYGKRFEETSENSTNPFFLMNLGKEIPDIMAENQLDLAHFCKVGVTMRDFLENGYTWEDLQHFSDISGKGAKRALNVIAKGLRTSANDFRDYPETLPFQSVREATKFKTGDICRLFGLTFPEQGTQPGDPIEGGLLECRGDRNWRAQDCIDLGLTISDLKDFGLGYTHQYLELMNGLSQKDVFKADEALQATNEDIGELIDLEAEAEEMERQRQEALQAEQARRRQAAAQIVPEEKEIHREEEIEYVQERSFSPGPIEEKEEKPLYEKRSKERARFHGLKKKR